MISRALFLCLSLFSTAWSQDSRGTIAGRITDPQDAGIAGSRVVITNVETGVATKLTTNDKGVYSAPLLIPGQYRATAEHDGFKRAARNDISLSVNDALQIDIRLELGSVTDSI